jgi:hypothetical protein
MTSNPQSPTFSSRSLRFALLLVACTLSALLLTVYEDSPWSRHDYIEGNPHVPFSGLVSRTLLLPVASLAATIFGPEGADRFRGILLLIIWIAISRTAYDILRWTIDFFGRARSRW